MTTPDPTLPPTRIPNADTTVPPAGTAETLERRRWSLLRDVASFQGKLFLDWLRDLLLAPISLGLVLYGFIMERENPGRLFYMLMQWGRWSDRAINLFGAKPPEEESEPGSARERGREADDGLDPVTVDALVSQLEGLVKRQYDRGGVTRSAKDAIDQLIDRIQDQTQGDADRLRAAATKVAEGVRARFTVKPESFEDPACPETPKSPKSPNQPGSRTEERRP